VILAPVLAALREPSSWSGCGVVAIALGLSAEDWQAIANGAAAVAGLVAIILRERKP
jgi:hypothetical protein